jgi:hypothetical protein
MFQIEINKRTGEAIVLGQVGYQLNLQAAALFASKNNPEVMEPLIAKLINDMRAALRGELQEACKQAAEKCEEEVAVVVQARTDEEKQAFIAAKTKAVEPVALPDEVTEVKPTILDNQGNPI